MMSKMVKINGIIFPINEENKVYVTDSMLQGRAGNSLNAMLASDKRLRGEWIRDEEKSCWVFQTPVNPDEIGDVE